MMYNIYLTELDINRQNTVHTFQQPHTFSAVLCLLSFRVTTVTLYSALEVTLLFMALYKITDYFTFHYISDHSDRHSHNNQTGVICCNMQQLSLSLSVSLDFCCTDLFFHGYQGVGQLHSRGLYRVMNFPQSHP